jgi:ribosomal-protein-alanine N-acetyltransferase
MNFNLELSAESVTLRQLNPSDITEQYISWLNNTEINQFLEVRKSIPSLVEQQEYVESCINSNDTFMLGIFSSEDNLIGSATLRILPRNRISVGLMIGEKSHHGRGIGKQVIMLVTKWATEQRFSALEAGYDTRNLASAHLFKSCGFEVVSELPVTSAHFDSYIIQTTMLNLRTEGDGE